MTKTIQRFLSCTIGCAAAFLSSQSVRGQAVFLDATAGAGITGSFVSPSGQGSGVAAADFDNDGDIDFFKPCGEGEPDRLYENLGSGTFTDVAASLGLDSTVSHRAAIWFDYDGDHDLDLAVCGDSFDWPVPPPPDADYNTLKLYRQIGVASGTFEDVTAAAGLDVPMVVTPAEHLGSMAAGDINNDGFLDLFVATWKGPRTRFFLNDGNGAFTDIIVSSGFFDSQHKYWQTVFHDFDGDGWMDIYGAVDFGPNLLWINQGDNTFLDTAVTAGADNNMNDMGVALGDYDGDGDLDAYVSNIYIAAENKHGVLFRNDTAAGVPAFVEVSEAAGVDDCSWGWGTTFLDADNNGGLDLAVTNGFHVDPFFIDQSRLFYNNADSPVTFTDIAASAGFNDSFWGFTLIAFDYDRDGDLDTLQTTQSTIGFGPQLRLLANQADLDDPPGNYLVIKPRMMGNNHFAIGAIVRISAGGVNQMRLITAGTSMMGQEPAEAHFGLGTATLVDSVTVEWPDGSETLLQDVTVNQVMTVTDVTGCSATAARSCNLHGATTLCFDILANDIEPRQSGVTKVEIDVDAGTATSASVACVIGGAYGGVATVSQVGSTVTVDLSPALPDGDACTLTLDCGASVCVRGLTGDIDRNGIVSTGDASIIKPHFGESATVAGAEFDFDQNDIVSTGDASIVKPLFGSTAAACP